MKKFFSTGVTLVMLVALFGASHYMQAQSGIAERAEANASQPAVVASCTAMPKVAFAATNNNEVVSTTSTSFVNLPPLSVTFKIGGTTLSCLKVDVTAVTYAPFGNLIFMRVLLDGATEFLPNEVQWSGDDDENANGEWARAHAANFYLANVAPGTHTVTVQWDVLSSANTAFAHWRSISVQHK